MQPTSISVSSTPMPNLGWADPPQGWKDMDSAFKPRWPDTAVMTDSMAMQLAQSQAKARAEPYNSDGGKDSWSPRWDGDCEDKCLAMRSYLVVANGLWRAGELRLAICRTEAGEPHCVLTAETDIGVLVLDPRATGVVPWRELPYEWIAREHPGYSLWERLS